LCPRGNGIPLI